MQKECVGRQQKYSAEKIGKPCKGLARWIRDGRLSERANDNKYDYSLYANVPEQHETDA